MTFKRIFLYQDANKKYELQKAYSADVDTLNSISTEIEVITGTPLTVEEKTKLAASPIEYIESTKDEIRSTFPFKKAPERSNLELLGLSFAKLDELKNKLSCNGCLCEVGTDGQLIESSKHLKDIERICEVHTQNERQNDVYNMLNEVIRLTNELKNYSIANNAPIHLRKAFNFFLEFDFENGHRINFDNLLQLK